MDEKERLHNFYNNVYMRNPEGVNQAIKDDNNIFYMMAEMSDLKRCNCKRPKEKHPNSQFDSQPLNKKHRGPNNTILKKAYDNIQMQ